MKMVLTFDLIVILQSSAQSGPRNVRLAGRSVHRHFLHFHQVEGQSQLRVLRRSYIRSRSLHVHKNTVIKHLLKKTKNHNTYKLGDDDQFLKVVAQGCLGNIKFPGRLAGRQPKKLNAANGILHFRHLIK
jgi:hypothetical protein